MMKRILSIQDVSCLGRCSQTIALPVLSAMGIETVVLPTALLSTHTGFPNPVVRDLSDMLLPAAQHWKREKIHFDAIYTGYLGSVDEIQTVVRVIDLLRSPDTLVFVDPVMGDHGRIYSRLGMDYVRVNAFLCRKADIIVPNITEACLLADFSHHEPVQESELSALLGRLGELFPAESVLTGVSLREGETGVMGSTRNEGQRCAQRTAGSYFVYQNRRIPQSFHGTGDLFASTAVGALVRGLPEEDAFRLAADYTALTVERTVQDETEERFGVNFEETLPDLMRMLKEAQRRRHE